MNDETEEGFLDPEDAYVFKRDDEFLDYDEIVDRAVERIEWRYLCAR